MAQHYHPYHRKSMLDIATPRRPITCCLECHRRKQKCSRTKPCIQCCNRGVPERCSFSGDDSSLLGENNLKLDNDSDVVDTASPPSTLADRAGYSATPASKTFLRLDQESLHHALTSPSIASILTQSLKGHESSYMRLVAQLPVPEIVYALLEFFFNDVFWALLAVDKHHLEDIYRQWLITPVGEYTAGKAKILQRELLHLPALLFQVLAQILHHLPPQHHAAKTLGLINYSDCDRLSQKFYQIGSKLVSILGRHQPTLCSVEHDIVACSWLKDSSRGTEAWYSLGNAVRQAQELGLHRLPQSIEQAPEDDIQTCLQKTWDLEHRKRIWARLFILDSILALMLGRPRALHRDDICTAAPLNCDYPQDTAKTLPLSREESSFSPMLVWLALAHKIHDILSFSGNDTFSKDYNRVLVVHDDIVSLREKVPLITDGTPMNATASTEALRSMILRLSLLNTMDAVLMTLHRPFIGRHPPSRSAAINAALEGLSLQQSVLDLIPPSQSRLYGPIFSTIEASVFLCGIMIDLPPQDPAEDCRIRLALLQAIGRLSAIKGRSPLAAAGEQMLQQFYVKVQAARQSSLQLAWAQLEFQQSHVSESGHRFRDIPIPSPYQPFHESYKSMFGNGQDASEPLGPIDEQTSAFGDPRMDDFGDFLHEGGFV